MDRASEERASLSNEETRRALCLLRTGTLTNTVYEVNNSTAALPEQLRVIHSGTKVAFIPEQFPDREHPAVFYVNFPAMAGHWSNI